MKVTIYYKDGTPLLVDSVDAKEILSNPLTEYSNEKPVQNALVDFQEEKGSKKRANKVSEVATEEV